MGFGDFAMGYLVGQSFSGPNHIPDGNAPYSEWSSQAKKDWDKKCDEAYWRAWDRACKRKVIERLRNPNDDLRFSPVTYPDISKEKWADLIESGEVKIVAPTQGSGSGLNYIWTDETREEAQREGYKQGDSYVKSVIANGTYRIVN